MRAPHRDDEPELAPPPELVRLRAILGRPPGHATRARHLAAASSASGELSGMGRRFASRGVRVAVAVVATLGITSGLAAAQVLPQPAQRFFTSVSDRFSPATSPPTTDDPGTGPAGPERTPNEDDDPIAEGGDSGVVETPTTQGADTTTRPGPTATTQPRTEDTTVPTVTIPGPGGPGSPDDPADPGGTDGGSGEPTDPTSTTTTTTAPGDDGGTTDAGTAATTTTTPGPGSGGSD